MRAGGQAIFLETLRRSPNVAAAARRARVGRATAYRHRASDPAFGAAWTDTLEAAVDDLVGSVWERAKAGSDVLAVFLLKCHRPAVYGDAVRTDSAGPVAIHDATGHPGPSEGRNDSQGVSATPAADRRR